MPRVPPPSMAPARRRPAPVAEAVGLLRERITDLTVPAKSAHRHRIRVDRLTSQIRDGLTSTTPRPPTKDAVYLLEAAVKVGEPKLTAAVCEGFAAMGIEDAVRVPCAENREVAYRPVYWLADICDHRYQTPGRHGGPDAGAESHGEDAPYAKIRDYLTARWKIHGTQALGDRHRTEREYVSEVADWMAARNAVATAALNTKTQGPQLSRILASLTPPASPTQAASEADAGVGAPPALPPLPTQAPDERTGTWLLRCAEDAGIPTLEIRAEFLNSSSPPVQLKALTQLQAYVQARLGDCPAAPALLEEIEDTLWILEEMGMAIK